MRLVAVGYIEQEIQRKGLHLHFCLKCTLSVSSQRNEHDCCEFLQVPEPPAVVWFGNLNPALAGDIDDEEANGMLLRLEHFLLSAFGPVASMGKPKVTPEGLCSVLVDFQFRSSATAAVAFLGEIRAKPLPDAFTIEVCPCSDGVVKTKVQQYSHLEM